MTGCRQKLIEERNAALVLAKALLSTASRRSIARAQWLIAGATMESRAIDAGMGRVQAQLECEEPVATLALRLIAGGSP